MANIKFISYTGRWPNLCHGELTLEVNGKRYKFGDSYSNPDNYESFWSSGGSCGFDGSNYSNSYITHNDWIINAYYLPEELQQYTDEIAEVFNENVPQGCCGGCL